MQLKEILVVNLHIQKLQQLLEVWIDKFNLKKMWRTSKESEIKYQIKLNNF